VRTTITLMGTITDTPTLMASTTTIMTTTGMGVGSTIMTRTRGRCMPGCTAAR